MNHHHGTKQLLCFAGPTEVMSTLLKQCAARLCLAISGGLALSFIPCFVNLSSYFFCRINFSRQISKLGPFSNFTSQLNNFFCKTWKETKSQLGKSLRVVDDQNDDENEKNEGNHLKSSMKPAETTDSILWESKHTIWQQDETLGDEHAV